MLQHIKLPVSALRRCLHPLLKESNSQSLPSEGVYLSFIREHITAGRADVRWAGDPPRPPSPLLE